jgi:hypothetical protein
VQRSDLPRQPLLHLRAADLKRRTRMNFDAAYHLALARNRCGFQTLSCKKQRMSDGNGRGDKPDPGSRYGDDSHTHEF